MTQPVGRVSHGEKNNYSQGRSGSGTKKNPGPAKGRRGIVNPTKKGGIYRPTKSGSNY
jgi:hypothetical protein